MTQEIQSGEYVSPVTALQTNGSQLPNDLNAIVNDTVGSQSPFEYDESGMILIKDENGSIYTKVEPAKLPELIKEKDRFASEQKKKVEMYEQLLMKQQSAPPPHVAHAPVAPKVDYVSLGRELAVSSGIDVDDADVNAFRTLGTIAYGAEQRALRAVEGKFNAYTINQQIADATEDLRSVNPNIDDDPLWFGCLEQARMNGRRPTDAKQAYLQRMAQMGQPPMQATTGYGQSPVVAPRQFNQNIPFVGDQRNASGYQVNQQGLSEYVMYAVNDARNNYKIRDENVLREVAEKAKQNYMKRETTKNGL